MAKIKFALYSNSQNAVEALREGHKDVAVIDCGDSGKTVFKMMGLSPNVPESLTRLPGFRISSISGTSSAPITSYVVLRTTQEVMETLRALEQ